MFYMTKLSYLIILTSIVSAVFIRSIGHTTIGVSYSMPLSYATLTGVMWCLYAYFVDKNIRAGVFAAIGSIVILLFGARNPLLAIVFYIAIEMVRRINDKQVSSWSKLISICFSVLALILVLNWRTSLLMVSSITQKMGITSRSIQLLLTNASFSSGRDVIHADVLSEINKSPLIGLGIGGDVTSVGESSHGLFLSILSSYGYVVGVIVIAYIIVLCLRALIKATAKHDKDVVLLYMCMVFPRAFVGGDIWNNDVFWWMLGICLVITSSSFIFSRES